MLKITFWITLTDYFYRDKSVKKFMNKQIIFLCIAYVIYNSIITN